MLLLDDGDPLTAKLPSRYAGGNQMTLYNIQQINDMRFLLMVNSKRGIVRQSGGK